MITTPTKQKVQLVLNSEEQQALIDLIDAAVRAQGLNVANNALCLALKVKNAKPHEESDVPGTCGGPPGALVQ